MEQQESVDETLLHDGSGWRLRVIVGDDHLDFEIQRQDGVRWITAQRWEAEMANPKQRRAIITATARTHGWIVASETWPRMRNRILELTEIFPWEWDTIVRDATAYRAAKLEEAAQADRAWRLTLVSAQAIGHMSPPKVAEAAGTTKHTIYRLKTDDLPTVNSGNLLDAGRQLLEGSADE